MSPILAEVDVAGWVVIIGALTTMATSIIAAIASLLGNKKVDAVQTLVNGHQERIMDRNAQLANTLTDNGVAIPPPPIPNAIPDPLN